ncbi:hypothetical protein M2139_002651 [Enterococcus sp. PF1-24]|uniref:immunoglobulin-like domain-containing protein n=1 Tax=unclassified Enterococcus TaxID=2608891 RepID=UPI002474073E|nr:MULTISPECIES: immunoglobulin-like domain-containing protein [unclassified Enterococcus]MDH6365644.1 hypothetical protein [Enterococcus sp. PFB1-1]MDH6402745.1 hypothetical protein [Enterococcus sp. PF1-24]
MKKTKLKFVGVCATTLLTVAAVAPSAAGVFGEVSVAQATNEHTLDYLEDATYEYGTFQKADRDKLTAGGVDVAGDTVGSLGVWTHLFPNAPADATIVEALGLTMTSNYKVIFSSDVEGNTTLTGLNQRTEDIKVKFEIREKNGDKTVPELSFEATIKIANSTVSATNLTKVVEDEYDVAEGVKVVDVNTGKEMVPNYDAAFSLDGANLANGEYQIDYVDAATKAFATDYVDGGVYSHVTDGAYTVTYRVVYKNSFGVVSHQLVTRTITVVADAAHMPILEVTENLLADGLPTDGQWIYYTNGQTVADQYAFTTNALNMDPKEGNNAYLATIVGNAGHVHGIDVKNEAYPEVNEVHLKGWNTLNPDGVTPVDNMTFDASGVDFKTAGKYYYTVSMENQYGAVSTFKVPLIVEAADNMPVYGIKVGHSVDMTIEVGDGFDPYEGIQFWENEEGRNTDLIPNSRVTIDGKVNTTMPGTYTLTYTATNKIGNTITVTRKITVVAKGEITEVPVYRAYNPNNGDHLYTKDLNEYNVVVKAGWTAEGTAFTASSAGVPVYRLYNPNSGEHFFTTDAGEYDSVANSGWTKEGTAFYSVPEADGVAVYRLFNPNAKGPGSHHFTKSAGEVASLVKAGWTNENTAFFAMK